MPQLTIVVACTDRKVAPSTPLRMMRNLSVHPVHDSLRLWLERLAVREQGTPIELSRLYRGDNWVQTQRLLTMAARRVSSEALVASAGLGLRDLSEKHAPYAATFSQSHPDTVAPTLHTVEWWQGLTALTGGGLERIESPQVVLVLSKAYARALDSQLETLGRSGQEVVLFGGWRDVEGIKRIKADRQLRAELGGSVGTLLPRMAQKWMQPWSGGGLVDGKHSSIWESWSRNSRCREDYSRKRMSDQEVVEWISEDLSGEPLLAASTALRRFRDAGYACEQQRFSKLFNAAKKAHSKC